MFLVRKQKKVQVLMKHGQGGEMFNRSFVFFLLSLSIFVSSTVQGANFDYKHYEAILNRYVKPNVSIDRVLVTAVDYAALASDAGKLDSDYSGLLKDLASFDPETLDNREDKMAF
jgi:hypothetical protein